MESCQGFIERKKEEFQKKREKNIPISMKDIGRKTKMFFIREAWTFMPQSNLDKKVFVIERLKKYTCDIEKMAYPESWKEGDIEYRFGYYIVGQIGRANNKWIWGQFCPIIPEKDLDRLMRLAKKEGTIK